MAGSNAEFEDRATEARKRYSDLICRAYQSGFSLMEIVRITGSTKPDYFYLVLRKDGLIQPMKRGRGQNIDLPDATASVFAQKGLSFRKWCHCWGFEVEDAIAALAQPVATEDWAVDVHLAFRRDFPDRYNTLFGCSPITYEPVVRLKAGLLPSDSSQMVSIAWDGDKEHYVASIYGENGIEGIGNSWKNALSDMEKVWWIHKGYTRLLNALKNSEL